MTRRIVWKSLIVSLLAMTAAESLSLIVRAIVGRPPDYISVILATVLPFVIAMPIAMVVFRQSEKLDRAYAALVVAHEALARKASRDQMTGLLNRESFLSQLDVMRLMPAGGTLLMVDADHFKDINDRFGHPVGDEALVRIASAIRTAVRGDDLVGRLGGEEFGAFLAGADVEEAQRVGQRLRRAVELIDFRIDGDRAVPLSVSVGGAVAKHEATVAELVGKADKLLYKAKSAGRNKVIIESALTFAA